MLVLLMGGFMKYSVEIGSDAMILSRDSVTIDGVWIGDSICCTL
jgi:hypothetical protein